MVRHYVRKRTFSTTERVLVHLSTDALRPEERTQEGIAAATRSARPTLTKWLDRMERRGLVSHARVRVDGHPLLKYAYRLSESGWRLASTLRKRLASEVVQVRAPNLGELSVRVSEVPTLASARLDLAAAVAAVRKGKLDLVRASRRSRDRGPLIWGGALRRADRFFGRTEELRDLDRWWSSGSRVLLITGLAGIGKSSLVAAWVQGRDLNAPVYGFEIHRSSTAASLLTDFGVFLAAQGRPALATHLAQGVPLATTFVVRLLERELGRKRVLVVIDNLNQAGRGMSRLLDELILKTGRTLPIRAVLVGRKTPRWIEVSKRRDREVEVRQIDGLDGAASKALLGSRGMRPDSAGVGEIVRKTRGHPLLLHLAATTGLSQGSGARRYLEEEVWGSIAASERAVLEAASIFRKPVTEHTLESVAGCDQRVLESLSERSLLERTVAGGYSVHDVMKEFTIQRLSVDRRERLHGRAANLLLNSADTRERWEGVYHLLMANRVADAASILDSSSASILDCVAAEEITSLMHSIAIEEDDSVTYCVFSEVLGDSLRIRGHLGPALFQYSHARRLAENSGQRDRVPRLLRKMAFIERCRNRYAKAIGYLVEARARLVESRDSAETIEVLREMALAGQALGELREARRHLSESVDLATESSDRAALSRTLLALASLQAQLGDPEQGLASSLEGLRIAERAGSPTEIAHAHIVVGAALTGLGRGSESLDHYDQGFETARLLANLRLMAYATMNRTNALLQLHRYADAAQALRQAFDSFEVLEEKDTLGFLKTYEGELEMELGHWTRATHAWEEGIAALRTHGSPADLAMVLRQVAGFYSDHGRSHESEALLLEAREASSRIGNQRLLSEVDAELDRLHPRAARSQTG